MADDLRTVMTLAARDEASAVYAKVRAEQRGLTQEAQTHARFSERELTTFRALAQENVRVAATSPWRRLAQDVQLASADFHAGRISVDDFHTAISTAQASALSFRTRGLAPVGADLVAFNTVMRATAGHTAASGHGMQGMTRDLAMLTAGLTGTNMHVGKLGASLATLGLGSLASLGLFAGLAAAAAGIELVGKKAREAKEEIGKFVEAQQRAAIAGLPEAAREALTVEEVERRITQQQGFVGREERRARREAEQLPGITPTQVEDLVTNDKKVFEARKRLALLEGELGIATRRQREAEQKEELEQGERHLQDLEREGEQRVALIKRQLERESEAFLEAARERAQLEAMAEIPSGRPAQVERLRAGLATIIRRARPLPLRPGETAGQEAIREDVGRVAGLQIRVKELTEALASAARGSAEAAAAQRLLKQATQELGGASQRATAQMIQSAFSLATGLVSAFRQGGAAGIGGVLGAVGGVLGLAGLAVPGAFLAGAGGLLTALFSRDEPLKVLDPVVATKLDELKEQIVPQPMIILEFRDPTHPETVKRFVAAANRVRARDGLPVVSVPLAVLGMED